MEKELRKIVSFVEENLRISKKSKIDFVDTNNLKARISTKQNHVVFGRRGAGKSMLFNELNKNQEYLCIQINMEDYKDITFPNILLHILKEFFISIKSFNPFYNLKLTKMINKEIKFIEKKLKENDITETSIKEYTKGTAEVSSKLTAKGVGVGGKLGNESGLEIQRNETGDKLNLLKNKISDYKKIIDAITIKLEKPVLLLLDDYYFIQKKTQPYLIDFIHRLTKDTDLYIKVATIQYRTKLYKQERTLYIGTEIGHDIFDINMDCSMENYDELESFMVSLIESFISKCKSSFTMEEIFSGDGFKQLCIASGGVPRDFLYLFTEVTNKYIEKKIKIIGKVEVTDIAINNLKNKMSSMKTDSMDERDVLEKHLDHIKTYIYKNKRTNIFLVPKEDLIKYPAEGQALKELQDLRLIHLIDENTSAAPSDGRRYEAYMLDLSLYDNSRPRNFNPIDISERKDVIRDQIRSSPRLFLQKMIEDLQEIKA